MHPDITTDRQVTTGGSPRDLRQPAPGPVAAVAMLVMCGIVLPASMPRPSSGVSKEDCLVLAERSGGKEPSLSLIERCSALYPKDAELRADFGRAYERTDPARAERAYTEALAIDPGYADLRLQLARLLLRRGDAGGAVREAEAALRVQPNRQVILDFLAAARRAAASL
jgi:tetratricopeptide (TPR) repeat protein